MQHEIAASFMIEHGLEPLEQYPGAGKQWRLPLQAEMFQRMSGEQDNLWAALDFCLRQPSEVDAGSDLAQSLIAFWTSHGPFGDVRRVITSLAGCASENSVSRARLLCVAAAMAIAQNDSMSSGPTRPHSC